jgi:single-stranded DNA-binding protein
MPEIKNPMLATATLTGRVCHTPEVKAFGDGKTLTKFSIAQDVFKKGTKTTNFWDVVAFGYAARAAEKLTRGENVQVVGTLRIEQWKGTNDIPRTSVKVLADTVRSMQWPAKDGAPQEPETANDNIGPDDIPF